MTDMTELEQRCVDNVVQLGGNPPKAALAIVRAVLAESGLAAQLEDALAELARLQNIIETAQDNMSSAMQSDCENGVAWLNEKAAAKYMADAPDMRAAIARFMEGEA